MFSVASLNSSASTSLYYLISASTTTFVVQFVPLRELCCHPVDRSSQKNQRIPSKCAHNIQSSFCRGISKSLPPAWLHWRGVARSRQCTITLLQLPVDPDSEINSTEVHQQPSIFLVILRLLQGVWFFSRFSRLYSLWGYSWNLFPSTKSPRHIMSISRGYPCISITWISHEYHEDIRWIFSRWVTVTAVEKIRFGRESSSNWMAGRWEEKCKPKFDGYWGLSHTEPTWSVAFFAFDSLLFASLAPDHVSDVEATPFSWRRMEWCEGSALGIVGSRLWSRKAFRESGIVSWVECSSWLGSWWWLGCESQEKSTEHKMCATASGISVTPIHGENYGLSSWPKRGSRC